MKESRSLKVYDPQRPKFFRDLPFTLTAKQVEYILNERPAAALASGIHLDVYKAFRRPENLTLLK